MSHLKFAVPEQLREMSDMALEVSRVIRVPATITLDYRVNPYIYPDRFADWYPMGTLMISPSKNKTLGHLACEALVRDWPAESGVPMDADIDGGVFLNEAIKRGVCRIFIMQAEQLLSDLDWLECLVKDLAHLPEDAMRVVFITHCKPSELFKVKLKWLKNPHFCFFCPGTLSEADAKTWAKERMGALAKGDPTEVLKEAREVKKNRPALKSAGNSAQNFNQLDLFQAFDNIRFKAAQKGV